MEKACGSTLKHINTKRSDCLRELRPHRIGRLMECSWRLPTHLVNENMQDTSVEFYRRCHALSLKLLSHPFYFIYLWLYLLSIWRVETFPVFCFCIVFVKSRKLGIFVLLVPPLFHAQFGLRVDTFYSVFSSFLLPSSDMCRWSERQSKDMKRS